MKINSIEFKNIASYGNSTQVINFNDTASSFYLVTGANGNGKCLHASTEIEISFNNNNSKELFEEFLKKRKDDRSSQ